MPSDGDKPNGALAVRARVVRDAGGFELDVDLELPRGITVVFGPSGSGKSTLLNVIAGLVRPDRGRVALGDRVWCDTSAGVDRPVHERRVAFVFQSLGLFPHMTAAANVEYGIDRRVAKGDRAERAARSLARFKARHLAGRRPKTFSGGEGQRVALARAFAMDPKVMLLDEPFSALEDALREEFVALLRSFASEVPIPIVHVTHDRAEALALADRVVLVQRGRIVGSGSPSEMLDKNGSPKPEKP